MEKYIPKLKKSVNDYLHCEDGKITKEKAAKVAAIAGASLISGSIISSETFADTSNLNITPPNPASGDHSDHLNELTVESGWMPRGEPDTGGPVKVSHNHHGSHTSHSNSGGGGGGGGM